jgi:hypothetical protein
MKWLRKEIMSRPVLAMIAAVLLLCGAAIAKEEKLPRAIAPDLVVESFEFGKFPTGHGPHEVSAEEVRFIPVPNRIVSGASNCEYGCRIKLRTNRHDVRIYRTFNTPVPTEPKKGEGYMVKPTSGGAIYETWLLDGFKSGTYWMKMWVEDVELPKLTYTLEKRYN